MQLLQARASALLELRRRRESVADPAPPADDWRAWLAQIFPEFREFAPHQCDLWEWVFSIALGVRPRPFVAAWARGGGKTSSAEAAASALGATERRKYCLYVRATQDMADKTVANVAGILESSRFGLAYPTHATRAIGKHGHSKGWRRNRLRTAGGYTVDALGLDTAARGIKVDQNRPDLIIIDDVDDIDDTPHQTDRKLRAITHSILPAGARDVAVLGIQNVILRDGIFAQLTDGRADFLADRIVSGPHPAVVGFDYESYLDAELVPHWRITAGEPTWPGGQDLDACTDLLNNIGPRAFLEEAQHEFQDALRALWTLASIQEHSIDESDVPADLERVVVGVDPAGSSKRSAADTGINVSASGPAPPGYPANERHGYVLDDCSVHGKPDVWARAAVQAYHEYEADMICAEVNYGGEMVESVIRVIDPLVPFKVLRATRGKVKRAEPVAELYPLGRVHHVRRKDRPEHLHKLEVQMCRFGAGEPETAGGRRVDRADAAVWSLTELLLNRGEWGFV